MEVKRQVEILNKIIQDLKSDKILNEGKTGICQSIAFLFFAGEIDYYESIYLKGLLEINKPTKRNKYNQFTKNNYWGVPNDNYWWEQIHIAPETIQIRIDYLTTLIYNVENNPIRYNEKLFLYIKSHLK